MRDAPLVDVPFQIRARRGQIGDGARSVEQLQDFVGVLEARGDRLDPGPSGSFRHRSGGAGGGTGTYRLASADQIVHGRAGGFRDTGQVERAESAYAAERLGELVRGKADLLRERGLGKGGCVHDLAYTVDHSLSHPSTVPAGCENRNQPPDVSPVDVISQLRGR